MNKMSVDEILFLAINKSEADFEIGDICVYLSFHNGYPIFSRCNVDRIFKNGNINLVYNGSHNKFKRINKNDNYLIRYVNFQNKFIPNIKEIKETIKHN